MTVRKGEQIPKTATGTATFCFAAERAFGPAMSKLTESQRLLVGAWVWGDYPTKKEACQAAGYKSTQSAADAFSNPKVREAIHEETLARIAVQAPKSIRTLERLQNQGKSEKVQFEAAKHLSGLAGHVQKQQVEVKHTHSLDDLSTEELNERIRAMHAKLYPQIEHHTQIATDSVAQAIQDAEFAEVKEAA